MGARPFGFLRPEGSEVRTKKVFYEYNIPAYVKEEKENNDSKRKPAKTQTRSPKSRARREGMTTNAAPTPDAPPPPTPAQRAALVLVQLGQGVASRGSDIAAILLVMVASVSLMGLVG